MPPSIRPALLAEPVERTIAARREREQRERNPLAFERAQQLAKGVRVLTTAAGATQQALQRIGVAFPSTIAPGSETDSEAEGDSEAAA